MNFSKVKELYLKYQLPFTLAVSTLILVISTFWNPALYISAGFIIVSYIFSSVEDICSGTFYYMLYSGFTAFFVTVAVGTFLIIFAKYIIDVCKKKVKVYKYILILTTIISIIFAIIHYKVNEYGFFVGLLVIAVLYFIYVYFCYHKHLSIKKMFMCLFAGTVSSLIISGILSLIPSAKIFMFYDWEFVFRTIKEKLFLVFENHHRLELLTYHPNHLSIYCLMLMSYAIYSLINYKQTKKDIVINALMIVIPSIMGFLTLSKAFYILFLVEVLYCIIYLIYKFKAKSLKYIIPIIVGLAVLCLIFRDPLTKTIERLLPNEDNNNLNDITTGRVDIWKIYLEDLISTPWKILFGEGIFTNDLVGIGPHNFYILIIFRFGIIGTLMLILLVILYVHAYDGKILLSWKRMLPILVFLLYSVQEANNDERIFFFIVTIVLMFQRTIDDEKFENDAKNIKGENLLKNIEINREAEIEGNSNINTESKNKINEINYKEGEIKDAN